MSAAEGFLALVAESVRQKGERLTVAPDTLPALRAALARYFGTDELVGVVDELCGFALWLAQARDGAQACAALLSVAETAIPALRELAGGVDLASGLRAAVDEKDYERLAQAQAGLRPELRAPAARGATVRAGVPSPRSKR